MRSWTDYSLRLIDNDGSILLEYPLAVDMDSGEQEGNEGANERSLFSIAAPAFDDLKKIQIIKDGAVVAERTQSSYAPQLELLEPQGGEHYNSVLTVRWLAQDQDQDILLATVSYSADGGQTFQTLGVDIGGTEFQYDASQLPGSEQAIVRVMVTDGFITRTVESSLFSVDQKAPNITILSPQANVTHLSGAPLSLQAETFDLEDGLLPGAAVSWQSNLDGALGMGNPLAVVLTEGEHTLTASVQDSDGQASQDEVQIFVVDGTQGPAGGCRRGSKSG